MADELKVLQNELYSLREEYVNLQEHLTDIELRYQAQLTVCSSKDEHLQNQFVAKLQMVVADMFGKNKYWDVVILLEGGRNLCAHKLILSARSEEWNGTNLVFIDQIDLTDVRYDVAYAMMKWVYTDEIDTNIDEAFLIELLQLATRFKLALHIRCQKALISCINDNNFNEFYKLSEENSYLVLKDYCSQNIPQCLLNCEQEEDTDAYFNTAEDDNIKSIVVDTFKEEQDIVIDNMKENNPIKVIVVDNMKEEDDIKVLVLDNIKEDGHIKVVVENGDVNVILNDDDDIKTVESDVSQNTSPRPNKKPKSTERFKTTGKCFTCDICSKTFNRRDTLRDHQTLHSDEKAYSCPDCEKCFRQRRGLRGHMKIHSTEKPFTCSDCFKSFRSRLGLKDHLLIHTGERPFKCTLCLKSFRREHHLKDHLKIHSEGKAFYCHICPKKFRKESLLQNHLKIHTEPKGTYCEKKPVKCDVCCKSFTEQYLEIHMRYHTGERPYICEICGQSFATKSHLPEHIRTHTGEKPLTCDVCGKKFTHRSSLRAHLKLHTGVKPCKCDLCGKAFVSTARMNVHKKTHTGLKPYKCDVCCKTYSTKSHLKRHKKVCLQKIILPE